MGTDPVARQPFWALLALVSIVGVVLRFGVDPAAAARISDVRGTRHNLSAAADGSAYSGPNGGGVVPGRSIKASSETQICVFCHTPHAATSGATPLWNRKVAGQGYTQSYVMYDSSTLDAKQIQGALNQPGGSSKLCLSCHDGTMAIGSVNVLNGQGSASTPGTRSITMNSGGATDSAAAPHKMPAGAGTDTGFTRNLGTDLSNDHPISVTFDAALASRDGELRTPDGVVVGARSPGVRPRLPLEPIPEVGNQPQIQCASCHDPHIREQNEAVVGNQKFLRLNRFQEKNPPSTSGFDVTVNSGDIICLACHDKNGFSGSWAGSAHANPLVATQTYTAAAAAQREFPSGMPVWKAACLNCHDTHSVAGSRRLLREGTDSAALPKSGGNPAIEETCYQCHANAAQSVITPTTSVPNIKDDFTNLARHMPIRSVDQPAGTEKHDISSNFNDGIFINCSLATSNCGKDFMESRARLGVANLSNRHAECTDCHNPHRVVKFRDFRGVAGSGSLVGAPDAAGTHRHTDDAATSHSNIASGVLRGAWGVEPIYGSASFNSLPTSYLVKRGDPGNSTDTSASANHVTREYQICLKCHSDYGYTDNNNHPNGSRPTLGSFTGGTPTGTNNLTQYTNQAREFQAPVAHKGETTTTDSGAGANFTTNNHRSWHPVMDSTGRTPAVRNAGAGNWNFPWRNAVGTQTMYCTDCHGSGVASGSASVIPDGGENGNPWGPHGSNNNFLLKGAWNTSTGTGQQADGLCFKCHSYSLYATRGGGSSGFGGSKDSNLHSYHADKIGRMRCNWCHVAVPHGWKNKALLVNLNDVGPEAGQVAGTQVRNNTTAAYNQEPYYLNAINKIRTFATSGNWSDTNCGSKGAPGNGQSGRSWMRDSSENCTNPP